MYLEKSIQRHIRHQSTETQANVDRTMQFLFLPMHGIHAWQACSGNAMPCGRQESDKFRTRSSKEGHRADALALGADERRDKLRKAAGRGKYPLIRRCLNGGTHAGTPCVPMRQHITHGGEPGELKHLSSRRKRKKHRFPE